MKKSVKFLDDGIIYVDNIQDFVQENNDFLVVGVVGAQAVGKSALLNLLAHNKVTEMLKKSVFTDPKPKHLNEEGDGVKIITESVFNLKVAENDVRENDTPIFKTQRSGTAEFDRNTTYGIDVFITNNRVRKLRCLYLLT